MTQRHPKANVEPLKSMQQ